MYESLDDLKRLRPLVQPNSNFMRQLVKWESDVSKTNIEPYNPYDFFSYQVGMECYNTPMAGNYFNYPCGILLCLTWSSAQACEGSNKGSNSRKAHEMINILREKHFLKDCGICLMSTIFLLFLTAVKIQKSLSFQVVSTITFLIAVKIPKCL